MATRKKQVTKKQAAEGRGVKCRVHFVNMLQQGRIDGGWDWVCPFEGCKIRWQVAQVVK